MFFDLNTGKRVSESSNPTLHYTDHNLHFWGGEFMWSIHISPTSLKNDLIDFLKENDFDCRLYIDQHTVISVETDENLLNFWFLIYTTAFSFQLKQKYLKSFVKFLEAEVNRELKDAEAENS